MEVHRLTLADGPRLRAIRLRSLADSPDAFGSTLAEATVKPPSSWPEQIARMATFVANDGTADVALVRGAPDEADQETLWLISMWVAPEARGQGVGEALIDALITCARRDGYRQILLDVADGNRHAVALYERKGFVRTGKTGSLPPPRDHVKEHERVLRLTPV